MKIFSVAVNMHDHNTYDGVFHNQIERYSRKKHNLDKDTESPENSRKFFNDYFLPSYNKCGVFAFTVSNKGKEMVFDLLKNTLPDTDFLSFKPANIWDHCYNNSYYYIDHHQSHAAYTFLSSDFTESDILSIDGRGWQFNCIFVDKHGNITDLTEKLSIGGLWNLISKRIGFGYLGAGKTMGLVGYGDYSEEIYNVIKKYLEDPVNRLPQESKEIIDNTPKENVAFTLQVVTEELIKKHVYHLKTSENICVGGGVAYNGYLNEELTKHYKNVHVPPAVGDEGQSLGTYMHADYVLNKNRHKPCVYSGRTHNVDENLFQGFIWKKLVYSDISTEIANEIANGKIVGWYQGKSESGNRALGNRSILADPRNPNIKNIINRKIKLREDFRPFAPTVLEEHYKEYFDTNQPSPYMSRIVPVKSNKIPGVVHVDGTARIQTLNKDFNEKFYNLIQEFYKITGIPMLLNTSFNCQAPIVETPEDAVATFKKCGLDILVINDYVIRKQHD